MGFWNTLGEASATLEGNEEAAKRFYDQDRGKEQQKKDFELQTQTEQILGDVQTLNDRRAKLDPNSPTYQKDLTTIDQALHDARQVFTDLYHPAKNPGALSKLHGFIQSHIGRHKGKTTAAAPATPAAAKQSMSERIAGIDQAAYAPTPGMLTYDEEKQAAKIKAGIEPRAGVEKPESENWVPATVKLADGKEITLQRNSKDGRWTYLDGSDVPKEVLSGATVQGKGGDKPPTSGQITLQAYEGAFEPPVTWAQMTPEQRAFFPRWKAMQSQALTVGQHVMMTVQNGKVVPVTIQTVSEKTFPGTVTPPGMRGQVPKTPAEAKSRIAQPQSGVIGVGSPIGFKPTSSQSKAITDWQEASGLDATAKQVEQHPDDAVNQKRLLVALERISAGRFTTQALDYIKQAGIANTIEGWAKSATTGALPTDILRQAIDGAHQNLVSKDAALYGSQVPRDEIERMKSSYQEELNKQLNPNSGTSGKKRVSIKKAMALPDYAGKSEEEVRQAIIDHGYEPY